jgi:hypothetical protein
MSAHITPGKSPGAEIETFSVDENKSDARTRQHAG